jgi:hypothetical protein
LATLVLVGVIETCGLTVDRALVEDDLERNICTLGQRHRSASFRVDTRGTGNGSRQPKRLENVDSL